MYLPPGAHSFICIPIPTTDTTKNGEMKQALVVAPGGMGTLDELFEVLSKPRAKNDDNDDVMLKHILERMYNNVRKIRKKHPKTFSHGLTFLLFFNSLCGICGRC